MFPAGQEPVDGPFLRHIADCLPDTVRILHRIEAENFGRSGRGIEQGDQNSQRGALARAVRTEQTEISPV